MKIKDLKIKIAMALTLVMMGAPAVKASAAELTTDDFLNMDNKEYMEYIGESFVKEFGTKDEFQTTFEDSTAIEKVNGRTGDVKAIEKGTNKEIYSYNFLESLKERAEDSQTTTTEDTNNTMEEYSSTLTDEQYKSVDAETLSGEDIQKEVEQIKKDIQKECGTEDKLKVVSDDGCVRQELNPATGYYRLTNKETNESISYNYYDDLNQVAKEAQTNK